MKKIVIITLCILLCFLLTGCNPQVSKPESSPITSYAMIIMPDGSIIKGECTAFTRISSGYAVVKIDGITYYTNEWRLVIWENQNDI